MDKKPATDDEMPCATSNSREGDMIGQVKELFLGTLNAFKSWQIWAMLVGYYLASCAIMAKMMRKKK